MVLGIWVSSWQEDHERIVSALMHLIHVYHCSLHGMLAQQATPEPGVGQQGELPRRAVTAADFFHRYPSLHGFLLQRLRQATLHLTMAKAGACPSLFPILALLSRLRSGARLELLLPHVRGWLACPPYE